MKELCKLKKAELQQRVAEIAERWDQCVHLCNKCGRVAPSKKWLCKPTIPPGDLARRGMGQ